MPERLVRAWFSVVTVTRREQSGQLRKATLPTYFWRHCWKRSVVRVRSCGRDTKNRSHLAELNRIFKIFVEMGVVAGWERVEEGVVLREAVLWRWTIRLESSKGGWGD